MKKSSLFPALLYRSILFVFALAFLSGSPLTFAQEWTRQPTLPPPKGPWSDKSLSPDQRADLLIQQMTLDEKL